jgi:hypothetical protein
VHTAGARFLLHRVFSRISRLPSNPPLGNGQRATGNGRQA